jgi:hypothetical protein
MSDPVPAASPAPRLAPLKRLRHWLSGGTWRVVFFTAGCLFTLGIALLAEENWRAEAAWNRCRQTLADRSEKLALADFVPPPVPPEQNFAATPLLAALFTKPTAPAFPITLAPDASATNPPGATLGSWRAIRRTDLAAWAAAYRRHIASASNASPGTVVLTALDRFAHQFAELRVASQRPQAQFPWTWDDPGQLAPHFSAVKTITQALALHAVAALAEGRPDDARADFTLSLKLDQALRNEPIMLAYLVRISVLQLTLLPVWEGLAEHRWSDPQLQEIQRQLGQLNLATDFAQTLRGERGLANFLTERALASPRSQPGNSEAVNVRAAARDFGFGPRALLRQNQIHINELLQLAIDAFQRATSDPANHQLPDLRAFQSRANSLRTQNPYRVLAGTLVPVIQSAIEKQLQAAVSLDLAVTACALERHRLAHGTYPARLELLVPAFLPRLPVDMADGQPIRYRCEADGQFVLYSVGLNGTDDGGRVELSPETRNPDPRQGDWVWCYPSPEHPSQP